MRTELAFEWDTLEEEIPNIFEELLRFIKRSLGEVLSYLEGNFTRFFLSFIMH